MDQEIRNKLRNVVTQCRKLLEDGITQELEGKYSIFAKKDQVTADPDAEMKNLTSQEDRDARKDILDHFEHIKARGFKPKDTLDQLVREIAFTHLNRLCAYKMMEAREVYVGGQKFREAVSRGINSNGVKFYLADHPEEERLFNTGHQDVAYRHFLDWLGGALSEEIGVLFNPNDPANRLYPRQKTLDDVLELLNSGGINAEETELREQWPRIWSQDETIGWVYQYFTPKELRDKARKESQAPRNSYELAFRNQFFTPRYVVEFLTDNTLGRIWYEMRKGETRLKDQCRYMVRRPTEIFLKEEEKSPKDAAEGKDDLSQQELLKLPVHIPHRPKKDPRELKVLDPASGSGHFLLYCFDLLLTIYEEAYADTDLGSAFKKDYSTLDALKRDVPRLILAHNLHGIDIDLRASQIAALALWLRCQRAYQEMGLKKDRPQITRSNFVCAEPMPGEEQMLKEFVSQLEPRVLGQVVEVVFDKMKLAGEAGSLLKIEEEIRDAVASAKKQYVRETTQATDRKGQPLLFTQSAMDRLAGKPEQPSLFDLSDITDSQFFEQAESRVIDALRTYAEKAHSGQRLQRRLFTEDAVRGFAFVDLCQKRYDVVLMNPPFGELPESCKCYLTSTDTLRPLDAYSQFIYRARSLNVENSSAIGCIVSKTFLSHAEFEPLRRWLLNPPLTLQAVVDLGAGVLDSATVETAAIALTTTSFPISIPFFDVVAAEDKDSSLRALLPLTRKEVYLKTSGAFLARPGVPFSYKVSSLTLKTLTNSKTLQDICNLCWGLFTANDERFCRVWWEVPPKELNCRWMPFAKGGETTPFYSDIDLVVDWNGDGKSILGQRAENGRILARAPNKDIFGKPGLTYSSISSSGLRVRILPAGAVFSIKGPGVFPKDPERVWQVLEMLNTAPISHLLSTLSVNRSAELNYTKRISIPCSWENKFLGVHARQVVLHVQRLLAVDERSHLFLSPLNAGSPVELLQEAKTLQSLYEVIEQTGQSAFEDFAFDEIELLKWTLASHRTEDGSKRMLDLLSYSFGCLLGRWDIRLALDERQYPDLPDPFAALPVCSPGMLQGVDGFPLTTVPQDYPLRIDGDGVVPDDADHQDDVVRRVRDVLELIWKEQAEAKEKEACELLGVKDLREYLRKPVKGGFWDDHISRYSKSRRNAPIYWLLQSSKKNYAIWLYYHRLDKDLLFKALVNYVEPKIRLETSRLDSLRTQNAAAGESGKEAKRLAKAVERQEDFISELRDFEEKLSRAANLNLEPDLNDGVVLNIAPLHELVPWKEAKKYWDELMEGQYEWSSIGKQLRKNGLVK